MAKLREERKIMIFRVDKDGKIVILTYGDYDAIMTKLLQQFEKTDVSLDAWVAESFLKWEGHKWTSKTIENF